MHIGVQEPRPAEDGARSIVHRRADIIVYEHIFDAADWEYILRVGRRPRWQFGHVSTRTPDTIPFWVMDLKDDAFFSVRLFLKILALVGEGFSLSRVYANGATYGQPGGPHTDSDTEGSRTFLIYANPDWDATWGGRTVFLLGDGEYSVLPKPRTAVCFPANVPHFAEDVSRNCTGLRVTVAYKLSPRR